MQPNLMRDLYAEYVTPETQRWEARWEHYMRKAFLSKSGRKRLIKEKEILFNNKTRY